MSLIIEQKPHNDGKISASLSNEFPKLTLHKEIRISEATYICDILLDNGVTVHLKNDGAAIGDDGQTYFCVSADDKNGDCKIMGYSSDIKAPLDLSR